MYNKVSKSISKYLKRSCPCPILPETAPIIARRHQFPINIEQYFLNSVQTSNV